MKTFTEKLEAKWAKGKFVCVGLDPDLSKMPVYLRDNKQMDPVAKAINFLEDIIYATAGIAAAFKPNFAFFEGYGSAGIEALESICQYIKHVHSCPVLIMDAKRADIGNTNIGSAEFFFNQCGVDAVTINPYLGGEALKPFLDYAGKGVFVLCRTSNPGAGEFQDKHVLVPAKEGKVFMDHGARNVPVHIPMYQYVAARFNAYWNEKGNCGLVTGATYPAEIGKVREVAPKLPLLIPGIGKQGGDLEASVRAAEVDGGGFLINSSRDILYASSGEDFAKAARAKAKDLHNQIRLIMSTPKKGHPYR